jgi:ornithine cyclodeaminase/alanine dehydrogenase
VTRWLGEEDVERLLPPPAESVALARACLVGIAEGTIELPPKPAIHPRPGAFVNAMPAFLARPDIAGVKVVSVYAQNAERELPAVSGIVVVCDAETGLLRGIVEAGALTAARTAGASGACIERLAPVAPGHTAMTGAGVEARSHLRVLEALGRTDVAVYDHHPANLDALRRWCDDHGLGIEPRPAASAAEAADGAAVLVTGVPIGAPEAEVPAAAVREDALVVTIDYSTSVGAELASSAALLACDDEAQLAAYTAAGHFSGWPQPHGPVGRWLADDAPPRPEGRVVVATLGVGAHDVAFADAVLRAAERAGAGIGLGASGTQTA